MSFFLNYFSAALTGALSSTISKGKVTEAETALPFWGLCEYREQPACRISLCD